MRRERMLLMLICFSGTIAMLVTAAVGYLFGIQTA